MSLSAPSQPTWQPLAEPWRATARRTLLIALAVGVGIGLYRGRWGTVPVATLIALWFTLGGHFVELVFLNGLRSHIGGGRAVQAVARVAWWFAGGCVLYAGARVTGLLLVGRAVLPWPWWTGGIFFIVLELFVHALMRARRP